MAPVFIRSLALVWRSVAVSATDLTPLESFYLRIGTGPSLLSPIEIGEIMSRNKPTGPQKGSAREKVDWKGTIRYHEPVQKFATEPFAIRRPSRELRLVKIISPAAAR